MRASAWSVIIFLTIFFTIYGGAHACVWWGLVDPLELTGSTLWLMRGAFVALTLSFPVVHFGLRRYNGRAVLAANYVSSVWMGMLVYFFLATVVVALTPTVPGRTTTAVVTVIVGLITLYGLWEAKSVVVTELTVRLKHLPPPLHGLRVAQISDVHMGWIVRGPRLARIVDLVNAQHPDLILITGDLVDEQALHMEDMVEPLRRLTAKYGAYAVTGNHEYFAGVERAQAFIEQAGVTLLRNRWVTVADGLQLIGRDDPVGSRLTGAAAPALAEIMRGIDPAKPSILLYHTPDTTLAELQARGIGLQLSGHTHKGQLWPFNYIVKLVYKTCYGRFTAGDTTVYVSRGTGTWGPPLRVLARPEITLITLMPA